MSGGRIEHSIDVGYQESQRAQTYLRSNVNYDLVTQSKERKLAMGVNYKLDERWTLSLGYTGARRTSGKKVVMSTTPAAGIDSSRIWADALAGQTHEYNAAALGLRYQINPQTSLEAEYASDFGSARQFGLLKIGAQTLYKSSTLKTQFSPYLRYEGAHGLKSTDAHAKGINKDKAHAVVAGMEIKPNSFIDGFELSAFTENRLRNNSFGLENQWVNGVRTSWQASDTLRINGGAEHLNVHQGTGQAISSLYGGYNWQVDHNRLLSGQLELRREHGYGGYSNGGVITEGAPKQDFVLARLNYAQKLGEAWTILLRNTGSYHKQIKNTKSGYDNQFDIGMAYRSNETNKVNALAKYSFRTLRAKKRLGSVNDPALVFNTHNEGFNSHIFSLHADYRPQRSLTISGRLAYKKQTDYTEGNRLGWSAALASTRAFYELNDKWALAAHAYLLKGLSSNDRGLHKSYGAEIGYSAFKNGWLSAGYNFTGFDAPDMTGNNYTTKGPYIRLRYNLPNVFGE
jgi:hypothetical protein